MTDIVAGASASFSSVLDALTTTVSSYFCSSGGGVGCWVVEGCWPVVAGGWFVGCCEVLDCDACGAARSRGAATTTTTAAVKAIRQTSFIHAPLNPGRIGPGTESTCDGWGF